MSKLLYGSIDFTKLLELAKAGNKAFSKAQNGKIYLNVNVWINDEKDNYGNDASIQTTFKDSTKEEKIYCGNLKLSEQKAPEILMANSDEIPESDDLPF